LCHSDPDTSVNGSADQSATGAIFSWYTQQSLETPAVGSVNNQKSMKQPPPTTPPTDKFFWVWFFAACVPLHLILVSLGWSNSLMQLHDGRQVQTALTAQCLQTEPWRLAYPLPVFGPPWSVPYEFPLYQTAVAWFANLTGWPIEQSGRAVALAFLYLALPACAKLLEVCGVPRSRRWLLPALLLFSPIYLYYSRSLMIESAAFCAACWFLLAFTRALRRPGWGWGAAAALLGAVTGLAKATTLAVFLTAALLDTLWQLGTRFRQSGGTKAMRAAAARALLATVPALAVTLAWIRYSDAVKASNPLGEALTSGHLKAFNYGTLAQRLDPAFWAKVGENILNGLLNPVNAALVVLFGVLLVGGRRRTVLGLIACFIAGPLLFANLYFVHDYYYYACGAFVLAALVVAWSQLLDCEEYPLWARRATVALSLGLQIASFAGSYLPFQRKELKPEPELGRILAENTQPDAVILVFGQGWNPGLAYYSRRHTVMVIDAKFDKLDQIYAVLDRIEPGRIVALVATGPIRMEREYLRPFLARLNLGSGPVLASADSHLYVAKRLADQFSDRTAAMDLREFAPVTASTAQNRDRALMGGAVPSNLSSMMNVPPIKVRHPFGLANHKIDNRPIFDAHAPCDLVFKLPENAREVAVGFGIVEGAYTGPSTTDGVEFRFELIEPDGKERVLRSIYLDPANQPDDRGTQQAIIALPKDAAGELWCRTLPGPLGNASFDWAYWSRIQIR